LFNSQLRGEFPGARHHAHGEESSGRALLQPGWDGPHEPPGTARKLVGGRRRHPGLNMPFCIEVEASKRKDRIGAD
jgi:hypothetical protein